MTTLKVRTAIPLRVVSRISMLLAAFVLITASVRADDICHPLEQSHVGDGCRWWDKSPGVDSRHGYCPSICF